MPFGPAAHKMVQTTIHLIRRLVLSTQQQLVAVPCHEASIACTAETNTLLGKPTVHKIMRTAFFALPMALTTALGYTCRVVTVQCRGGGCEQGQAEGQEESCEGSTGRLAVHSQGLQRACPT